MLCDFYIMSVLILKFIFFVYIEIFEVQCIYIYICSASEPLKDITCNCNNRQRDVKLVNECIGVLL